MVKMNYVPDNGTFALEYNKNLFLAKDLQKELDKRGDKLGIVSIIGIKVKAEAIFIYLDSDSISSPDMRIFEEILSNYTEATEFFKPVESWEIEVTEEGKLAISIMQEVENEMEEDI